MSRTVSTVTCDAGALRTGVAGLLALDLVGGGLAVATGWNTATRAWSGDAVLAAPLPMMAAQTGLAVAAGRDGRSGAVAAGLLAGACLVSAVSGFFDGQFARHGLPGPLVAFQVTLVTATLAVGALAVGRLRHLVEPAVGTGDTTATDATMPTGC